MVSLSDNIKAPVIFGGLDFLGTLNLAGTSRTE